ncbi:unnamed protein product [Closterium sp. Naga37s-1]|nr:unnamed protein product [Closterium sp. Naga37s-1]
MNGSTQVGVGVGVGSPGGAVDADHGVGPRRVQVGTQITVSGVSLDVNFDALGCFSFPQAALKALKAGRGVQVWWHGLADGSKSGSKVGSKGGGSSRGKEAGTDGAGAACKQLQFFANPACKGKALDEVLKPQYAGLRKFFNVPSTKKVSRWTSVSCKPGAGPFSSFSPFLRAFLSRCLLALVTLPPALVTLPPALVTLPPALVTLPPALVTLPPALVTLPPALVTLPPALVTWPPALVTLPPTLVTLPPALVTLPPTLVTLPPALVTLPPTLVTLPPALVTLPPTLVTLPPALVTLPPCLLFHHATL